MTGPFYSSHDPDYWEVESNPVRSPFLRATLKQSGERTLLETTRTDDVFVEEHFAATQDGRYIFIAGLQRMSSEGMNKDKYAEDVGDEESITFTLDCIDLFLSKRVRVESIGDFFGFGKWTGFCALNKKTLSIFEYHQGLEILRQHIVIVDVITESAESYFYRTYSMTMRQVGMRVYTRFSQSRAITICETTAGSVRGFVHEIEPLSTLPPIDITALLRQAYTLERQLRTARGVYYCMIEPFVINDNAIGWLVDRCTKRVAVLDLINMTAYLTETWTPKRFSFDVPMGNELLQLNDRECILVGYGYDRKCYALFNTRTLQWTSLTDDHFGINEFDGVGRMSCRNEEGEFILYDVQKKVGEGGANEEYAHIMGNPLRMPSLTRLSAFAVQRSGRVEGRQMKEIAERIE